MEQASKLANVVPKDGFAMTGEQSRKGSPMRLNMGKINDELQSDDDNEPKFKSRTSMEQDRRPTEQVLP